MTHLEGAQAWHVLTIDQAPTLSSFQPQTQSAHPAFTPQPQSITHFVRYSLPVALKAGDSVGVDGW